MSFDDKEPKDWEIEDEEPPEKLQRKWNEEELSSKETVVCPACRKRVPRENLTCIFCGARVFQDSGFLGKILAWLKRIF